MSKQLQIRRGTTAQNNSFVGAVGEITLDTQKKQLHIHNGSTAGGTAIDYVVAWQMPNIDNNFKWYRKYASGWVEQGGLLTGRQGEVTFAITMADTNYNVCFTGCLITSASSSGAEINPYAKSLTETSMYIYTNRADKLTWQVSGMAA